MSSNSSTEEDGLEEFNQEMNMTTYFLLLLITTTVSFVVVRLLATVLKRRRNKAKPDQQSRDTFVLLSDGSGKWSLNRQSGFIRASQSRQKPLKSKQAKPAKNRPAPKRSRNDEPSVVRKPWGW